MSARAARRPLELVPAELWFVASAIAQYGGAVVALRLIDEVPTATVAFGRVFSASLILTVVTRPWRWRWSAADLRIAAGFGVLTTLMNLFFYLAIERLPLGKSVTIEFIGPIAVAAARTRTRRNGAALGLAVVGVVVLSGTPLDGASRTGLAAIFAASLCWAGYIVFGYRVSSTNRGAAGLGVSLGIGAFTILPLAWGGLGRAVGSASVLGRIVLVGLASSAVGYGIDQSVMRRISTRRFAVLLALLPVVALVSGGVALGQRPTAIDLVGVAFVLFGVTVQDRK